MRSIRVVFRKGRHLGLCRRSLGNDPAADEEVIATTRIQQRDLEPFTGGNYQNIEFELDESAQWDDGSACERLAQVNGQYNP